MSEQLQILTQIAADVGEVKGTVFGIRDALAAHVAQDQLIQQGLFDRLGALELAHASAAGHAAVFKSIAAGLGAISGAAATVAVRLWKHW